MPSAIKSRNVSLSVKSSPQAPTSVLHFITFVAIQKKKRKERKEVYSVLVPSALTLHNRECNTWNRFIRGRRPPADSFCRRVWCRHAANCRHGLSLSLSWLSNRLQKYRITHGTRYMCTNTRTREQHVLSFVSYCMFSLNACQLERRENKTNASTNSHHVNWIQLGNSREEVIMKLMTVNS